jgi:hypothetical protein
MTVPPVWVDRNGGNDAISIVRMADDGTVERLVTSFNGYSALNGYALFRADSPHGLCIFALMGSPCRASSGCGDPSLTSRNRVTHSGPLGIELNGSVQTMLIPGGALLLIVAAGAFLLRRKKGPDKESRKKK